LWENEAHLAFLTNPEKILKELVVRVRPLATGAYRVDHQKAAGEVCQEETLITHPRGRSELYTLLMRLHRVQI